MQFLKCAVSLLIFVGASALAEVVSASPLGDAARSGDSAVLAQLLNSGADPNEAAYASPLYSASANGHLDAVKLLIAFGADVNTLQVQGSAMQIAARRGHVGIVEFLLASGANPNLPGGEHFKTPLHEAAHNGSVAIITLLLDYGADVNARAIYRGRIPPIHYAALRGNKEAMRVLQERGAHGLPAEPISIEELKTADLQLGKVVGITCTPCHTYTLDKPGERGPSLWNIFGREIASQEGFPYSPALKSMTGNWDVGALNMYLADMYGNVPGTDKFNATMLQRTERIAVIAYIRMMADDPVPLE